MAVKATLSGDKKKLTIVMDIEDVRPSASGKTLVVASTRGNMETDVQYNGKPLVLGINAYTKN